MEAAEHWEGDDVPLGRALCGERGLLMDPLVGARGVVVADVLGDAALEVPAVEHENVVRTGDVRDETSSASNAPRGP